MGKKELFEDIKIYDKKGGILTPIHTIGWKFSYKGNQYGNLISDQVGTGKFYTYWECYDDGEPFEVTNEIMRTVPITPKKEIALMENMIEVMKKLGGN